MSADHCYLLDSGPGGAAENMAVDEALLQTVEGIGSPILRFYSWSEAAATFGYSQRYGEVERWTKLRPLIRRPTGGGLVLHAADWTYSVVVPPNHEWYRLKAHDSYRRMHEWIQAAFSLSAVCLELARCAIKEGVGQCFIGAERFDLLWHGRKVGGAAQRRNRHGLLIQGSLQPPESVLRNDWERSMQQAYPAADSCLWTPLKLGTELCERIDSLTNEKYSQASYNQRR